jgi:predicted component of type VI protein secretion system
MIRIAISSKGLSHEREFGGEVVTIGRSLENTLVVQDMRVSRRHARIETVEGGCRIVDLESRFGTRLNGREIERSSLLPGDEIQIGESTLWVLKTVRPAPAPPRSAEAGAPKPVLSLPVPAKPVPAKPVPAKPVPAKAVERGDREGRGGNGPKEGLRARLTAWIAAGAACVTVAVVVAHRDDDAAGRPVHRRSDPRMEEPSVRAELGGPIEEPRLDELKAAVESAISQGRYGEAMEALLAFKDPSDPSVRGLLPKLDAEARRDFEVVDQFGRKLQQQGLYEDAAEFYALNAARFRGTVHHWYLSRKPAMLEGLERAEAEGARRRSPGAPAGAAPLAKPPAETVAVQRKLEPAPSLPAPAPAPSVPTTPVPPKAPKAAPKEPPKTAPAAPRSAPPARPEGSPAESPLENLGALATDENARQRIASARIIRYFGYDGAARAAIPVDQGAGSLVKTVRAGEHYAINANVPEVSVSPWRDEVCVSYYLYLPRDFSMESYESGRVNQLKLARIAGAPPGFAGGWGRAGVKTSEDGYFRVQDAIDEGCRLHFYVYHWDMGGSVGDIYPWKGPRLERERWYHVEYQVKLNTVGRSDGIVRGWLNGRLLCERSDMRFRMDPKSQIRNVALDFYFGGAGQRNTPKTEQSGYFDSFVVSQKPLGPLPGNVRKPSADRGKP